MTSPIVYYDNALDEDQDDPGWFDIERIYCFDWDAFRDEHWNQLAETYERLPLFFSQGTVHYARWFSPVDNPTTGYLWAGVETPGLQVAGTLTRKQWESWDLKFRQEVVGLPFRKLR